MNNIKTITKKKSKSIVKTLAKPFIFSFDYINTHFIKAKLGIIVILYLWFQTLVLNKWITPFIGNFWLPVALKTDNMLIQILIAITIYVLLPMFTGSMMGNLTVWLYLEDINKNAKNKE